MTMTKRAERLPRSPDQLGQLADFYDTHDTSPEMLPRARQGGGGCQ